MNEPVPFDPALWLIEHQRQVTAPTVTAPLPPPTRSWLWRHFARIAPGLIPSVAWALAWTWHHQLPAGSTEPLWVMGTLTALTGGAGIIAASKQHGDKTAMSTAFAAAGTFATTAVAAWTPHWPLSVLMWLTGVAAAYALCAPHWRQERTEERRHKHATEIEQLKGYNSWRDTATRAAAAVETARLLAQTEVGKVQAIVAASDLRRRDALLARQHRALQPGEELDVKALLRVADQGPGETEHPTLPSAPDHVLDDEDLEALLRATTTAPHEPTAAERTGQWR